MIKRMGEDRRDWEYTVIAEEKVAMSSREKAKTFVEIHSSEKLSEEERRK